MKRRRFFTASTALLAGGMLPIGRDRATADYGWQGRVMDRVIPERLRSGDTVAFVAPAGRLYDMDALKRMKKVMEEFGFNVRFGRHVRNRHGYFAGRDEERADDINRFFKDPDIRAIIAVRGGWGTARILPMLDFESLAENPKILCGFSDITALQMAVRQQTGLVTYHGPNGTSDWTSFTRRSFRKTLMEGLYNELIDIPVRSRYRLRTIRPGKARGYLLGGNLTLLVSLAGTPYEPDLDGSILFLEDIGEQIYRVDRMLTQMRLAGMLDGVRGVVFGRCSDCEKGPGASLTLEQVLKEHFTRSDCPIFYGAMISHEPDNLTLPQGVKAEMDADEGTLILLESPVA